MFRLQYNSYISKNFKDHLFRMSQCHLVYKEFLIHLQLYHNKHLIKE